VYAAAILAAAASPACAQLLFSEDFTSTSLDPTKWRLDNQPFESGTSDIAPSVGGGYLTFSGTQLAGWWGGSAVATVPTFKASPETNLVFQVDRVSEGGSGTATRSAIWITDANRQRFVFFGENRGEGNWRYNRKINADGDNPTGGGTGINAFNQGSMIDLGFHTMKAVVNGQSVKLYLDGVFGAEVAFPLAEGIVFEIGSYARAVNDVANNVFANVSVTAAETVLFTAKDGVIQNNAQVLLGTSSTNISVKIPAGQNATQSFTVRITTADPTIAVPMGAVGDTLTLTFPAGGPTIQEVPIRALKHGGTTLTLQNDAGVLVGNELKVLVPYGAAGVLLEDQFAGTTYDTTKWELNTQGFEVGVGDMNVSVADGQLKMSGGLAEQYWGGVSLKTTADYVATKDLPLVFEMDRVSLAYTGSAGRSGVYITTADRSQYVFFGQNYGENGWQVNVNPGNPTGGGTTIGAFSSRNNGASHRIRLVADGSRVNIYLDGIHGGSFSFPVSSGIKFEIGTYARALGDTVQAAFDNVKISTEYSPVSASPSAVVLAANQTDVKVTVSVSPAMVLQNSATVTVTSGNPGVAVPAGAVNGALTLTFPAGGSPTQSFTVTPVAPGTTTFELSNPQGAAIANNIQVSVTESLYPLLSDLFAGTTVDATKWRLDDKGLEALSAVTNDSYIAISNGVANVRVVSAGEGEGAGVWWGGLALATVQAYSARPTAPVSFEIDRLAHQGTGAERRSAILIADESRQNWVMFSDNDLNGGWVVDLSSGTLRQNNTSIPAFADSKFRDGGKHRMKLLADGTTVKLYLDGIFGVQVPFALSNGIIFEFGAFARSYPDSLVATFDNALVTGPIPPVYATPAAVTFETGQTTNEVITLSFPAQAHQTNSAKVVITSSDPAVAIPVGGTGGSLTLTFGPGAPDKQTFQIARVGAGIATFTFSNDQGVPTANSIQVIVENPQPNVLLADSFDAAQLGTIWSVDSAYRFEAAWPSAADTTAALVSGMLELSVNVTANYWPGIQVLAATNFQASLTQPLVIELDRVAHLSAGTGTRSGIFLYSGTNFVWYGDNAEGGVNWGYNWDIGTDNDQPAGTAIAIAAFGDPMYRDGGYHRMKLVANGQTVRMYLDDVFGTEIPFPFGSGLQFAIMAAGRAEGDVLTADFDNLVISGTVQSAAPITMTASRQNGAVVISWTGTGTLLQASAPQGPWTQVQGATNPYTIPANALEPQKYYRVMQ
jgi:hypothetical protein